jgi:hypothetical protein
VLVVTALLFARTLHNLTTVDSGFNLDGVGMVVIDYQSAKVPPERRLELQARLLDSVRSIPAVQSAASVRMVPLTGESWTGHVVIDGLQHQKQTYFNRVSPAFFETMGGEFIAGRDFTPDDSLTGRRVAIVNESFARGLLGRRNPIGSTFQMPASHGGSQPTFEIVGLVKDTKYTSLREPFEPTAFFAALQERRPLEYVNFVVRTTNASLAVTQAVTEALRRTEPEAVVLVQPFQAQIADSLVRDRLTTTLSGFFGAIAALLAMLGLYGVVAYGVTQRTREIGIRTALGRSDRRSWPWFFGKALCSPVSASHWDWPPQRSRHDTSKGCCSASVPSIRGHSSPCPSHFQWWRLWRLMCQRAVPRVLSRSSHFDASNGRQTCGSQDELAKRIRDLQTELAHTRRECPTDQLFAGITQTGEPHRSPTDRYRAEWWAHLVGAPRVHPHKHSPTILPKKIEDVREFGAFMFLLPPAEVPRMQGRDDRRKSRPEAHFNLGRRAPEPYDAHINAPRTRLTNALSKRSRITPQPWRSTSSITTLPAGIRPCA